MVDLQSAHLDAATSYAASTAAAHYSSEILLRRRVPVACLVRRYEIGKQRMILVLCSNKALRLL